MENEFAPLDLRLRSLLSDADLNAKQVGGAEYDVRIPAPLREWVVNVRMNDDWVDLKAFVLALPSSPSIRAALLEAALRANARMSLGKFCLDDDDALVLELEYRQEHLDSAVLRNLVCLTVKLGEAEYPRFFRLATAQGSLEFLEAAFNRSATEG